MKTYNQATISLVRSVASVPRVASLLEWLKKHHEPTYEHSRRVAEGSVDIAYEQKLSSRDIDSICKGALLHDIGKAMISPELLDKVSDLTSDERREMEKHPLLGQAMVRSHMFKEPVEQIIVGHHEYKFKSYPRSGEERRTEERNVDRRLKSSPLVEIVAVVDMCDALASPRAYKPGLSLEIVKCIMEQEFRGDPRYIDHVLERYFA